MLQSMLGASTKLPACIAAWINYAAECSYYFLYLLLFWWCFGCDFLVDCFVMFRVELIFYFFSSFLIVTNLEIHTLIVDVCVCLSSAVV